jgi:hypothetical protein
VVGNFNQYTGSEVLIMKIMKTVVFWVVMLHNSEIAEHFEGIYQAAGFQLLLVCFLFSLFFGPKDGGDMLLQNVNSLQATQCYCTLQPINILYRRNVRIFLAL